MTARVELTGNLPLAGVATYSQGGWILTAELAGRSSVNLTDLAADLLAVFGVRLPTDLPAIMLTELALQSYSTSDGSCHFRAGLRSFGGGDSFLKKITGIVDLRSTRLAGGQRQWSGSITGTLAIGAATFTVEFDFGDAQVLRCAMTATSHPLEVADLVTLLGIAPVAVPDGLNPSIAQASLTYNLTSRTLVLAGEAANVGSAVFVSYPADAG